MEPKQCFWGQAYVAQSGHACTQTLLCAESSSSLCQFTSARDRRPRLLEPRFPQRDPRGAVGAAGGCSVLRKEAGGPRGPGQGVRGPGCGGGSGGAAEPAGVSELSKLQELSQGGVGGRTTWKEGGAAGANRGWGGAEPPGAAGASVAEGGARGREGRSARTGTGADRAAGPSVGCCPEGRRALTAALRPGHLRGQRGSGRMGAPAPRRDPARPGEGACRWAIPTRPPVCHAPDFTPSALSAGCWAVVSA